jgi:hypothetical protein
VSTEETEDTARRRRRHLPVATVAAAVLLAGGGGAYWASAASDGESTAPAASDEDAPPPLTLDDLGSPSAGHGDVSGIAPGEPNPYGTRYRASGDLPDGPRKAAVHRAGEVTKAEVADLAKALGMSAAPRQDDGRWRVGGDQDGTGPVLRVGAGNGGVDWSFSRNGPGAPGCMHPLPEKGEPGSERPKPSCPSQQPGEGDIAKGEPVPEQRAERAVREVLKPLGLEHAKLSAAGTEGAKRLVTANPVVDGLPTVGWSSTFTVGPDGTLAGGHGRLGDFDKGTTYPVLDAEHTLAQLNDSRSGGNSPGVAPGEPDPSGKKDAAEVTDARFTLATHFSHGDPLLVPSWSFTVQRDGASDTFTVGYPAVQPALLKLPGEPQKPSPRPSAPRGDRPVKAPTAYTADGRTLTVWFWGGVCGGYRGSAQETDQRVTVSVEPTGTDSDRPCITLAKRQHVRITLDEPLGDRTVVDNKDGKRVPAQQKG